MPIHNKDDDYCIPVLAPYVQWVKAYRQLISALYKEHKTVRRVWRAFRDAMPGVEKKLEFSIFEEILLFSLFLSEWNNTEKAGGPIEVDGQTKWGGAHFGEHSGGQLDTVIQKLQNAFEERDRALWNLKHLEQSSIMLRDQKADLADQAAGLKKKVEALQIELDAANERLRRVIHELDGHKVENAHLKGESVVLREKETSLEHQIEKLRKKLDKVSSGPAQTRQIAASQGPRDRRGVFPSGYTMGSTTRRAGGCTKGYTKPSAKYFSKQDRPVECATLKRRLLPAVPENRRQGPFDLCWKRA